MNNTLKLNLKTLHNWELLTLSGLLLLFSSFYNNPAPNTKVETTVSEIKLNLVAECKVGNTLYWRVVGDDNISNVSFSWNGSGANDGTGTVDANDVYYFTTYDNGDANTVIITWFNPVTNKNETKTKAHSNKDCVYHIEFEKSWQDATAPNLKNVVILNAESSIAKATCGYNTNGTWYCTYTQKSNGNSLQDLEVPFGEQYTVTEKPTTGWEATGGVGAGFEYIQCFDNTKLPDSLVYLKNLGNNNYARPVEGSSIKFGIHTVVNRASNGNCANGQSWLKSYNLITLENLKNVQEVDYNTFVGADLLSINQSGNQMTTAVFPSYTARSLEVAGKVKSGNTINLFYSATFSSQNTIVKTNATQYKVNGRDFNVNHGNQGAILTNDATLTTKASQIKSELESLSKTLSALQANNTLSFGNNGTEARFNVNTVDANGLAVFNITDAQVFENATVSQIVVNNNVNATTILINVAGTTINWNGGNKVGTWLTSIDGRSRTLWNFYEATSIYFDRNFMGALLAPKATLQTSVNIDGSVAVKSLDSNAEIHLPYFIGNFCTTTSSVALSCKTLLQGAALDASSGTMSNSLQTYSPCLLPTQDPYSGRSSYGQIDNPAGPAGAIVDWIEIQVRSANDLSLILERKSLLLKTNGNIVEVDGSIPTLRTQQEPVHLVIRHRNHLPVISQKILSFTGAISYDFTSGLAQAFSYAGDPNPMTIVNGTWCMWAGNAAEDEYLDGLDVSVADEAANLGLFDAYLGADVNLDGYVDGIDIWIVSLSADLGIFSPLNGSR